MKKVIVIFSICIALLSCKKEVHSLKISNKIQSEKQDSVFNAINQKWVFTPPVVSQEVKEKIQHWLEWHTFEKEITTKPLASLSAFRSETQVLESLVNRLYNSIPYEFQRPEIENRILLLSTHIKSLDMMMELDDINQKEIDWLITNINKDMQSIMNQFDEFIVRSKIPMEEGEERAYPSFDEQQRASINALNDFIVD